MKTNKSRLFALIICLVVAFTLAVFTACKPDEIQSATLDRIELDTSNVKTQFVVGDTLTYQGLTVTAVYDDGASAIVTGYAVSADALDVDGKLTVESKLATVSYTENDVTKTASYDITVSEGALIDPDDGKTVVGIEIVSEPTTTDYYVGEAFTTDGMEIKVTYDDGATANLTTGFNATASTAMAGEKTITVTYAGKTDTFTITVYDKLSGIAIDGQRAYNIGDEFSGVTVSALYNNKTSGGVLLDADNYTLTISPELTNNKFSEVGAYKITVTYGEEQIENRPLSVSETFTVNVLGADEYALQYSTEADYVANIDLVGKWVYYHNAEENGAEIGSKANGTYINDTVTLNFTDNVDLWWCVQLFYKNPTFATGTRYTVKMTLLSDFSGSITVNGNVFALEQGVAQIVDFTVTQGDSATLSVLLGTASDNAVAAEWGKIAIYDVSFEKINSESGGNTGGNTGSNDNPGGNTGGGETVETAPYQSFFDPDIIGVWFRTSTLTEEDFASAELLVNGEYFAAVYQVQTGGNNEFRPMFSGLFGLAGSADGTKYTLQVKVNGVVYDPIDNVGGGPHTSNGNTYTISVEGGKLVLTVQGSSSTPSNPGGGTTTPPTGGDGYVLTVTSAGEYGATYVQLRMTEEDFELLKTATTVVVNSTFTGGLAGKGFEVVGENAAAGYVNVQIAEGPTDGTTFVIEFYNGDTLIATYTYSR